MLHLSSSLSIPIDACTQTFAWIGRKGSGKTYGAGKLVEELLANQIQTVILDTVGNWYGLRIAADGKGAGFDVPVFGGLRQDLPLLPTAGDVVADVIIETGRSVILDMSQFNFSDRKRFAASFGERLWQRKKSDAQPAPLHLVIEECQLIVPQFVGKDDTRMVHVYEEIIRLGRNYGIGVSMLTQRPQSVNKEVLTQAECIMGFQINGVPERKALKDWLTYEGGDVNLVNALPSLPIGTCYLWSPQWLRVFKRITIGLKQTFDASATPKAGHTLKRRNPAPLDVKDIESRMTATIEKANADNPKTLRSKIAELERTLAKSLHAPRPADPIIHTRQVFANGEIHELQQALSVAGNIVGRIQSSLQKAQQLIQPVSTASNTVMIRKPAVLSIHPPKERVARCNRSQQRILNALLWAKHIGLPALDKTQLALLSDQSPTSGGYFNNLGALRTASLLEYPSPGMVSLTLDGEQQAEPTDIPTTSAELHEQICRKLSGSQERILRYVIAQHPRACTKEQIATETGQSPTSGGYFNNLGRLRSLGLIDYPKFGHVMARDILFINKP